MTAGNNLGVRIWRMVSINDDEVGGYLPTGTVLYEHAHARRISLRPTMPLLEQGVETNKITQFSIAGRINVLEKDILEITSPVTHYDYGKKYSIVGVQPSDFAPNDHRFYLIVSTTRIERAHGNNLQ